MDVEAQKPRGAWERPSSPVASPGTCVPWVGASCTWLCTRTCSSLVSTHLVVCCSSPTCSAAGKYEAMQHLFFTCPDVAAVADWLVRLWVAVSPPGSSTPPCATAVLLSDDDHVWHPTSEESHRGLWTILRLCWLQEVSAASAPVIQSGTLSVQQQSSRR